MKRRLVAATCAYAWSSLYASISPNSISPNSISPSSIPPHSDDVRPKGKYETVPYTNRNRFICQPISLERSMGEHFFEEYKQKHEVMPPTDPGTIRVRKILTQIIDALHAEMKKPNSSSSMFHLDGLNWEISVIKEPDGVITRSYAGGKIVTTTRSVRHYQDDAAFATILAHEVAHVVARHHAELETRFRWVDRIHDFLNLFVPIDFKQRVRPCYKRLLNQRFEFEADYIGLLLMAAAGYDPQSAPTVYEKLDETEHKFTLGSCFDFHPPGRKRAQALTRREIMKEALTLYNDVKVKRANEPS